MQKGAINSTWGRSGQGTLLGKILKWNHLCGLQYATGIVNPCCWKWPWDISLAPQKSTGCCPSSLPASQGLPPFSPSGTHGYRTCSTLHEIRLEFISFIYFFPSAWTFEDTFVRNLSLAVFRNKQIWLICPLNNLYIWHIYPLKKFYFKMLYIWSSIHVYIYIHNIWRLIQIKQNYPCLHIVRKTTDLFFSRESKLFKVTLYFWLSQELLD